MSSNPVTEKKTPEPRGLRWGTRAWKTKTGIKEDAEREGNRIERKREE